MSLFPRRIVVPAAMAALAACSSVPPETDPSPVHLDTTFFVSARARENGQDTHRLADSVAFGLILTAPSGTVDPVTGKRLPFVLVDSIPLTREQFVTTLRARTAPEDFAVLYTHGFGTSLHEGWRQAVDAHTRSQGSQPWVVFNWPAADGWLSWPKNGNLLATSYRQDSASAVASRGAFLLAFGAVREAVGSGRLLLFTHSMGVQIATESMAADDTLRAALTADPLRGIAFFAPDVDAVRFGDVLIQAVRPLTTRLVLYASSTDRALAMAGMISDTERAGRIHRSGDLPLVRPGLESIDMTEGASAAGFFRRLLGARHGIRHASAALFDLVHVVGGGFDEGCRETLGTAKRTGSAWKLRTGRLPPPAATDRCTAPPVGGKD